MKVDPIFFNIKIQYSLELLGTISVPAVQFWFQHLAFFNSSWQNKIRINRTFRLPIHILQKYIKYAVILLIIIIFFCWLMIEFLMTFSCLSVTWSHNDFTICTDFSDAYPLILYYMILAFIFLRHRWSYLILLQ